MNLNGNDEVLVNEVGEFVVGPRGTARQLVRREVSPDSGLYATLKSKHFLYDDNSAPLLDILATKYRSKHTFIDGFTKLHIFVVTLRCDHTCHYCQVSRQTADRLAYDMSIETAKKSVDLMLANPGQDLTLEFQGGEPLLAFDLIKQVVDMAKDGASHSGKNLRLVITTNLANATDEMLLYCRDQDIAISTSLDGPAFIHNANRPRPGNNSYELTVRNIKRARDIVGYDKVAALMTTTQLSLEHPREIIDEYVSQGFHSVFLRPISPYGFALKTKKKTGYEIDAFLNFFKTGLEHIISINKSGYNLAEIYSKILLTKILTPFGTGYVDLQSPAGAGISVLVYNYDGGIFATDESRMLAEMGDFSFRLGHALENTRDEIFTSDKFLNIASAACNEALPGCSDCAFQMYCGSDPVFNHATQGDVVGHRPTSDFCRRNMAVIRHLLQLITSDDPELMRMFFAWIRNVSLNEVWSQ